MSHITLKEYLALRPGALSYSQLKYRCARDAVRLGAVKVGNVWTLPSETIIERERAARGERKGTR